ncbi:MAG: DUF805 domain-containing protein [Emticicia sp.]|nr:DUF805 domain-containing protein [Emticicia sp.]
MNAFSYFTNAITNNYTNFEGRARRSEYWYFTLFSTIISWGLSYAGIAMNFPWISVIYSLAIILPSIALTVRRMHDVGKSGWFMLIPIYNLILACTDSEVGQNQYGPNPKGIGNNDNYDDQINTIGKSIQ